MKNEENVPQNSNACCVTVTVNCCGSTDLSSECCEGKTSSCC